MSKQIQRGRHLRFTLLTASLLTLTTNLTTFETRAENDYSVYVDKHGRMRRSDTNEEVRYYGTNYTLPFAHAYRAMNMLDVDHKRAIDRDVYHLSRMGANAFRLHLWDAELADSTGNLIDNEHLDLLDYLLSSLENRGISIILTAQTNFGNGYPEKNIDTGAFTYDFGKCEIHENTAAIKAQERYISQLIRHINPYTGRSYADDRSIIAMEINNEPCHQSDSRQVKNYINTMAKAMRKSGWKKPILYNVSHNMPVVEGYYNADIDGTTYQWYPIGLVAGKKRKGNFLPYVDNYNIPFSNVKGFDDKAKVVYEFDPADMLDSYMFPAVARTFAREGFQWATQFAYDPIDMARFNTEYQTHYLNLAYTPQKALGMKIAAKVMEQTPNGADYGKYPTDTVFGDITVSYRRNLAQLNSDREFFHTNRTYDKPKDISRLEEIAGYGSSPIVDYEGRGAYLIDKINDNLWRLEVMPDMLYSADPFGKPSLTREVAHAISTTHPMTLWIPGLGGEFYYQAINEENPFGGRAEDGTIEVIPGVYLLSADSAAINATDPLMKFGHITLNEFVAPVAGDTPLHVNHSPAPYHESGKPLVITAEAFGNAMPDSLIIYPADASFWRDDNRLYTMKKTAPYKYEAVIPADELKGKQSFGYRIVAADENSSKTFPAGTEGAPLDWDAPETAFYQTRIIAAGDPVVLLSADDNDVDVSTIPDEWGRSRVEHAINAPMAENAIRIAVKPGDSDVRTILSRYVKNITASAPTHGNMKLYIRTGKMNAAAPITIGVVNTDGVTFAKEVEATSESTMAIALDELTITPTLLCPAPYPVFLEREMMPENYTGKLRVNEIEKIQITIPGTASDQEQTFEIIGTWLGK